MKALNAVDLNYLKTAPNLITCSVQIDATPEEVFTHLEKPETWIDTSEAITDLKWTSPKPFKAGTTRTVYLDLPQGNIQVDEVFIVWEQNKRMSFYFSHLNKKIFNAVLEDYVIDDLGNGRSKMIWKFAYQGAGIYRPIFSLIKGKVKKDNQKSLDNMAAYIEKNK